jgi:hypothetical protein
MPRKKIHLSDVQTLTFQRGELTRSNKNQRVDKVTCLGGCEVVGSDVISQARCKNDGIDDMGDVNWRCTASIPKGCRFYETTVSCERFRDENGNFDPDDDFIVPGSCAFEYVFSLSLSLSLSLLHTHTHTHTNAGMFLIVNASPRLKKRN